MNRKEWDHLQQAAATGTIRDEANPAFIFSLTSTDLLLKIATGELNAAAIAKLTLEARGVKPNETAATYHARARAAFKRANLQAEAGRHHEAERTRDEGERLLRLAKLADAGVEII